MIPPQTVARIKEVAQIEDIVGDFVPLKKRGANFIACCPFHNEKTPSFSVSPTRGIYKCFGCGEAGNSINFVMEHENMTYPDALRYIAQKYNIHIEEVEDEQGRAERQEMDSLFIVNHFGVEHFIHNLKETDEGKSVGLSYFKDRRHFTDATIEKFQLGYSLDDFDTFPKVAQEKGYRIDLLKKVGLIRTKNNRDYPFFRGRVMFPIHSLSGKVVAFAGRTLKTDKKIPKYVNSPETEIYVKSKILYGMYQGKQAIRKTDNCFLVEGYTDVISMHQEGVENVVASSGTSLTTEQIKLIKRYTKNVTLLFDGDAAGIKAALRGVDMILEEDMAVKVLVLPDGEDPDSYVQENGKLGFEAYAEKNTKDFIFFKANLLLKEAEKDPIARSKAINAIIQTLTKIPDPVKRSLYIKECAHLLDLSERIIITETNKLKRQHLEKKQAKQQLQNAVQADLPPEALQNVAQLPNTQSLKTPKDSWERDLIRILLEHGDKLYDIEVYIAVFIIQEIEELPLTNTNYQQIVEIYHNHLEEGKILSKDFFIHYDDAVVSQTATELLGGQYVISENWEKLHNIFITETVNNFKLEVEKLVTRFKLKWIDKMTDDIGQQIKEAQQQGNHDACMILLQKQMQLLTWKKELSALQNSVILR